LKIIENISSDPWNILEPWPCQAMCPSWTSWPWVSSEATANLLSHTLTSDIRTLVRGAFDDFDGPESTIWWTHIGNQKAHIWYIMIWFSLSGAHTCSGHPPKILNLDLHCIDLFQVPTADWCVSSRYIYNYIYIYMKGTKNQHSTVLIMNWASSFVWPDHGDSQERNQVKVFLVK
jgi:hypothetical protein